MDDDECVRELLRLQLEAAGYRVRVAEGAIPAGYAVLRRAPDLMLCQIDLPDIDGFEFVAAMQADPGIPPIRVIFLASLEDGARRAAQLGAREYLVKPVMVDRLLAAVARRPIQSLHGFAAGHPAGGAADRGSG